MIKNIILDMGKVLVEWDCDSAFRKLGFDDKTLNEVADATVRSADWNEYDRSLLDEEEQLAFFIHKAPEYEKEIRLFWDNMGLPIFQFPYARGWIAAMKQAGYRVYILSNYAKHTYDCTREALSFLSDVDGAVFSFQKHRIKPEPELYEALTEQYGLNPAECLFLDDKPENIETAKRLGWNGIVFTTYEEALQQLKEYGVEL